mgnify:CR=1 FL=1
MRSFRPRSHECHIAQKHIEELWEFIQTGFAQKPPNGSDSRIIVTAQLRPRCLGVHMHRPELDAISDEAIRFDRFVELNVFEQVLDLGKTSIVQAAWERGQEVHVHGWVYDIHDGMIRDLQVTLKDNETLSDVYKLDL